MKNKVCSITEKLVENLISEMCIFLNDKDLRKCNILKSGLAPAPKGDLYF